MTTRETIWITSSDLAVEVWPGKGADVLSLVDLARGANLLYASPWAGNGSSTQYGDDSEAHWLSRYRGGWQMLLPHAGAPRQVDGVVRAFHGEASLAEWTVTERDESAVTLQVDLVSAPLQVRRRLSVDGRTLLLSVEVENNSAVEVEAMWVEHLNFGQEWLARGGTLTVPSATILTDAEQPGTLVAPDALSTFPLAMTPDGRLVDLSAIPGHLDRRMLFAALTNLDEGWYEITTGNDGSAVRVSWDLAVLPYLWVWQEFRSTETFPWFGRGRVMGLEPANVLPG
jgi:hypothetical protein